MKLPYISLLLMYLPGRTIVALFLYQYTSIPRKGQKHASDMISHAQLGAIFGVYIDLHMRTTFATLKRTQINIHVLSIAYKSEIDETLYVGIDLASYIKSHTSAQHSAKT